MTGSMMREFTQGKMMRRFSRTMAITQVVTRLQDRAGKSRLGHYYKCPDNSGERMCINTG